MIKIDEKQKLIMDVAKECFTKQGLQFTSIYDIVKTCKISKATFYKYFSTKEDLVDEILAYANKKFLSSARAIDENIEINNKDKLKKKIILVWEYLISNTPFNLFIIENFSQVKGQPMYKFKEIIRNNLLSEYYKSLTTLYGDEIESIVWEIIFLIDSLVHEFTLIMRIKKEEFEPSFVSDYVIRIIEMTINELKKVPVVIEKSFFYSENGDASDKLFLSEQLLIYKTIGEIKDLILRHDTIIEQKKLTEAINMVEKEAELGLYDSLIMDAMLSLLEKEKSLKIQIAIFNKLKSKLGDDTREGNK
ncbi:TetR/AcrR family transcriptional regulator [Clostridium frigoris]|uniref:TetR/AcrR family transcriptional regulator n=1 Tax=Clostridium frigoris TaxID=205327 RepID=A0ABS6BWW0_9CLOT|nr:TetR/AcrR family transcriptional regulator [Clostridium frigoris]MBU3160813.1 TetR/AcrR family transcriptional regulator [Clostridium frigoris]